MDGLLDPNYGPSHRAFLQALTARGALTFEDARPILAAIWNAGEQDGESEHDADEVTEGDFLSYIDIARQAVSLFDYDIRTTVHQISKERLYVLVNTTSDPQTQLATTYSADELSFIKRVFDSMFETFNSPRMEVMALTQMQAMKVARPNRRQSQIEGEESTQSTAGRGLKHSEVEDVFASLVNGGWLEKSRNQYYSLTPRALIELRPWLIETYNDPDAEPDEWQRIKLCAACKDLITYGLRCAEPRCNFRLHDICEDAFWRVRGDKRCPKCSREWDGKHYVGERAVTQRRRPPGGDGGRRTSLAEEARRQESDQDDGEESSEPDD